MKNIFEGAKFGDKFVMSDGKIAVFHKELGLNRYTLLLEDFGFIGYFGDGSLCGNMPSEKTVISKYEDTIDEDKLNELAYDFTNSRENGKGQDLIKKCRFEERIATLPENIMYYVDLACIFFEGFKAGYRKAKEE